MTKHQDLVQGMVDALKISYEEAEALVGPDPDKNVKKKESSEELLLEAQATLNYFLHKGKGFYKQECKVCHRVFSYDWYYLGIKTCSIECMSKALEEIGLNWNPGKPLEERWGYRAAPAVVSPQALEAIHQLYQQVEIKPEGLQGGSVDNGVESVLTDKTPKPRHEELDRFLEDLDL